MSLSILGARVRLSLLAAALAAVGGDQLAAQSPPYQCMPPECIGEPRPIDVFVFFDFGATTNNFFPKMEDQLKYFLDTWTFYHHPNVPITGHSDAAEASVELSQKRADLVKERIVALGIPPSQITVVAAGDTQLLLPTGPGVREPQNRRVELLVLPRVQ